MKKRDLLNYFDEELLEKLFGFCYARTGDSYEAEELCSDITYALIKACRYRRRDRKPLSLYMESGTQCLR